jgi:hypothetical protein
MQDWPRLTSPELCDRLRMSDEDFVDYFRGLIGNFPPREATAEMLDRGRRYPWYRPTASYVLRDGEATLLADLDPAERDAIVDRHTARDSGRRTLLAYGSNGAPRQLGVKLAHHEHPADREVLALTGEVHDLDVVASAAVTVYGAMPATIAASPGTAVRVAMLRVTATQLETLALGEMPYRIGRIGGLEFTADEGVPPVDLGSPLVLVSRWGAFAPDGEPAALAAIPAQDRRFRAWEQRELLDYVAELVFRGEGLDGEGLVSRYVSDPQQHFAQGLAALRAAAQPFEHPGWVPIPSEALAAPRTDQPAST